MYRRCVRTLWLFAVHPGQRAALDIQDYVNPPACDFASSSNTHTQRTFPRHFSLRTREVAPLFSDLLDLFGSKKIKSTTSRTSRMHAVFFFRILHRIRKSSSEVEPQLLAARGVGDMRHEPELTHPGGDDSHARSGMSSGIAKAAALRSIGKQASGSFSVAFLSWVTHAPCLLPKFIWQYFSRLLEDGTHDPCTGCFTVLIWHP